MFTSIKSTTLYVYMYAVSTVYYMLHGQLSELKFKSWILSKD